ncbi:MAG TPA: ATP-binding protein [Burkholderiaceae bacterium]|nr:ATP-binding protein [Burkholderiaceae bacterium]
MSETHWTGVRTRLASLGSLGRSWLIGAAVLALSVLLMGLGTAVVLNARQALGEEARTRQIAAIASEWIRLARVDLTLTELYLDIRPETAQRFYALSSANHLRISTLIAELEQLRPADPAISRKLSAVIEARTRFLQSTDRFTGLWRQDPGGLDNRTGQAYRSLTQEASAYAASLDGVERMLVNASATDSERSLWRTQQAGAMLLAAGALLMLAAWLSLRSTSRVRLRLQASEARRLREHEVLQAILRESPDLVMVMDENDRFVIGNKALADLLGTQEAELIGRRAADFPAARGQTGMSWRSSEDARQAGRTVILTEAVHDATSGQTRQFYSLKHPFRTASGATHLLVIARDITAMLDEQERIRQLQQRLSDILDIAGEGMWDWQLASGRVENNARWCEMLGFAPSEAERRIGDFEALLHPEDREPVRERLAQALASADGSYSSTHRMVRRDGTVLWVEDRGRVVERDAQGVPLRMLGAVSDITQKRAIEEQLADALAKADAMNASKSRLLASMSHEIRTPIHGIVGLTELLLRNPLPAGQRHQLELIESSARTLIVLVNDLLTYFKLEAERVTLESIRFDLTAELDALVRPIEIKASGKGVALQVQMDADMGITLEGDPTRMRQVLTNLLDNAVKFTSSGRVLMRVTESASGSEMPMLQFEVIDTGPGIAAGRLKVLFQPFVQEDATITRRFGGTGLGLSICARLVELMGGDIAVSSTVGQGTRFVVRLPLRNAQRRSELALELDSVPPCVWIDRSGRDVQACTGSLGPLADQVENMSSDRFEELQRRLDELSHACVIIDSATLQRSDLAAPLLDLAACHTGLHWIVIASLTEGQPISLAEVLPAERLHLLDRPVLMPQLASLLIEAGTAAREHATDITVGTGEALLSGLRVLLVDDNEVNRLVAQVQLAGLGMHVDTRSTGEAAWSTLHLQHDAIDLVLMDVQLPDIDGLTVTRRLRDWERQNGRTHLPVIGATAFVLPEEQRKCRQAGMDEFLGKPFRPDDLQAVCIRLHHAGLLLGRQRFSAAARNAAMRLSAE